MPPLFNGVFSDLFRDPKWVVLWLPFNCKKVQNIFSLLYDVGFSWKSVICELTIWRRLTDHPLWLSKLVGLFCLNVWSVLETRLQHVSGEILVEEEKHLLDFAKAQEEPYALPVTDRLIFIYFCGYLLNNPKEMIMHLSSTLLKHMEQLWLTQFFDIIWDNCNSWWTLNMPVGYHLGKPKGPGVIL